MPHVEVGPEVLGVPGPDGAVDAVGRDDHVGVTQAQPRQVGVALQLGLESHGHVELGAAFLKDVEQLPARDAGKAVAARRDDAAADVDVDVVPVREAGRDALE